MLIIAHAPLASSLKAVASHAFPDCGARLEVLDVAPDRLDDFKRWSDDSVANIGTAITDDERVRGGVVGIVEVPVLEVERPLAEEPR